jgi:hypothetical protein
MEKRFIYLDVMIVADEQSAKVSKPCEGSFHFVAFAVAAKFLAIVEGGFLAPAPVWADQHDASFQQASRPCGQVSLDLKRFRFYRQHFHRRRAQVQSHSR